MIAPARILVRTDFSPTSDLALRDGRELAGAFGSTLHVLHALSDLVTLNAMPETYVTDVAGLQREREEAARERLEAELEPGVKATAAIVTSASPAFAIVA